MTHREIHEKNYKKSHMISLVQRMKISKLYQDVHGDYFAGGKPNNRIYGDNNRYSVMISRKSRAQWENTKVKLSAVEGLKLQRDGDTEGIYLMEKTPNDDQSVLLCKIMGIRRKMNISDEKREELRKRGHKLAEKFVKTAK